MNNLNTIWLYCELKEKRYEKRQQRMFNTGVRK